MNKGPSLYPGPSKGSGTNLGVGGGFSTGSKARNQVARISSAAEPALFDFQIRCELTVAAVRHGALDLVAAADQLQAHAETSGLIAEHGQDRIQEILSRPFATLRGHRR
jgi:hypothetical protein